LKIYSFILSHLLWHYILYMKKVPSLDSRRIVATDSG
jgi:hypothetical protein